MFTAADKSIKMYLAEPSPDNIKSGKAVIVLPDFYGIWKNTELLADNFAAHGYLTVIPDIFEDDQVEWHRDPPDFNIRLYFSQGSNGKTPHLPVNIDPIVSNTLKVLQDEFHVKNVAAAGYCIGAKV